MLSAIEVLTMVLSVWRLVEASGGLCISRGDRCLLMSVSADILLLITSGENFPPDSMESTHQHAIVNRSICFQQLSAPRQDERTPKLMFNVMMLVFSHKSTADVLMVHMAYWRKAVSWSVVFCMTIFF